eukprot:1644630-Prorocentrum_lima.AAC.1
MVGKRSTLQLVKGDHKGCRLRGPKVWDESGLGNRKGGGVLQRPPQNERTMAFHLESCQWHCELNKSVAQRKARTSK